MDTQVYDPELDLYVPAQDDLGAVNDLVSYQPDQYSNTGGAIYADPGASTAGSINPPSTPTAAPGGSGFGTFLGSVFGAFTKASGVLGAQASTQGRTASGAPCALGTVGCAPVTSAASVASGQNVTMLILVGVGALVLIIALRKG